MVHQRKRITTSTPSTMHKLEANDLRHIRGGEDASSVLVTQYDTVKNTIGNIR